ncbi:unnamed protein product [Phytophthora fragariaefolia]|uniref:Unnamed protein product n=1 Tax=Phytophthora fragariaefolia TaxID=1490495 RepID=A0A9W6YCQ4_9STRA|nr:unnamed protein product [Phytophthora fragariaefolia]
MSSSGSTRSPGERGPIGKRFTKARRRGNSQGEALSSGGGGGMSPVSGGFGRNTISFARPSSAGLLSSSPAAQSAHLPKDEAAGGGGFVSSKTGFLTKRAMSSMDAFANWKERFFVLAEGHLSYYKQGGGFFNTGKEDIVHLKGELELTPDTIVRKSSIDDKANCFEVVTPTKKMFCQASTAREMEDWVKSVRAHINALKKSHMRGSFHDAAAPVNLAASGGPGVTAGLAGMMQPGAMETDYSRPSMLEDHEIVRGADKSSDPKDVVIKQLLEENRALREQLTMKDQVIHELETNGGRSVDAPAVGAGKLRSTAPQMILDLRDVKKKQFQLFDAAEVGNWHLIATLLRDNVVDVNGVGINQTSALHLAARNNHPNAVKELLARGADPSARTGDSYTALHIAVQAGNVEYVLPSETAYAGPVLTSFVCHVCCIAVSRNF